MIEDGRVSFDIDIHLIELCLASDTPFGRFLMAASRPGPDRHVSVWHNGLGISNKIQGH